MDFWVVPLRCPGNYYVAGLRVTYQVGSGVYTGNLYSGGGLCVRIDWQKHARALDNTCNFSGKDDAELTRMSSQGA